MPFTSISSPCASVAPRRFSSRNSRGDLLFGARLERDLHDGLLAERVRSLEPVEQREDAVTLVLDGPALRKGQRDAHVGVIETVVAHDALRAARTVGQAVDGFAGTHRDCRSSRLLADR